MCVFILCLCCPLFKYRPCDGLTPIQRFLPTVYGTKSLIKRSGFKRALELLIITWGVLRTV
jgi:hypothetical protein